MSDARHAHHHGGHQGHLSGDFPFHDDLASLFALDSGATPMQQPWFTDYLQAITPAPLDCDLFAGAFGMPAVVEEVKRGLAVDPTGAASGVVGMPPAGGRATSTAAPLTLNSVSLSSTSSEAFGAVAGEVPAAGKCKKQEMERGERKEGSAGKVDGGDMDDKNKKGSVDLVRFRFFLMISFLSVLDLQLLDQQQPACSL
jgi:hypothetical protein